MQSQSSSRPAGFLLGRFGLLMVLGLLLLSAWYGQTIIVIVLALVLSAAGLSNLWSRYSLAGVSAERFLSERRIFPGESVELKLSLANRKLLPLPWIQLDYEIPLDLTPDIPLTSGSKPGYGFLSRATALLWYTRANWKQHLSGNKRGYYAIGPISLTSGDIFGFYPRSITEPVIDHVIVYPRIFPIPQLGIPPLYPIGEAVAERRIFEDPVRVIGVRDYSPLDSCRRIHWKASARHHNLQVKVFEPTTSSNVAMFLAVDSFKPRHGELSGSEDFELGISAAASVANYLAERRGSVGLFVNTQLADSGRPVEILPGGSHTQLMAILEALAKVTHLASSPFEEFLQAEYLRLPWGTTLIFIVSRPSPALVEQLISLKESCRRLMVLQVGDPAESKVEPGLAWCHVRPPCEFFSVGAGGGR